LRSFPYKYKFRGEAERGLGMNTVQQQALLDNPDVVNEIKRHCWIESEKMGQNMGFENAARDWISKYADAWIKEHQPTQENSPKVQSQRNESPKTKKTTTQTKAKTRNRSAKAYIK